MSWREWMWSGGPGRGVARESTRAGRLDEVFLRQSNHGKVPRRGTFQAIGLITDDGLVNLWSAGTAGIARAPTGIPLGRDSAALPRTSDQAV